MHKQLVACVSAGLAEHSHPALHCLSQSEQVKAVSKAGGDLLRECCSKVDSQCGTKLWPRAQERARQAALQAGSYTARSSIGWLGHQAALTTLHVWRFRREQLLPQLQHVVRAAKHFRFVVTASRAGAGAASETASSLTGNISCAGGPAGCSAGSGAGSANSSTKSSTSTSSDMSGVPAAVGGGEVPLVALEREVALACLQCANPLCDKLRTLESATRLRRCRGCMVATYCG